MNIKKKKNYIHIKMKTSKFLNKKVTRKNFPKQVSKSEDNIIISIDKSDINIIINESNNSYNYFKPINTKKSSIIEKIEKSDIKYGKCAFNNSNVNYKIEKINLDIPIIPKFYLKPILFISLIYYNNKCLFFIGHSFNLLVYELKGNDLFFIASAFNINQNDFFRDKIDKIYLLNENNLSEKINFLIIDKKIHMYEFNFQEKKFRYRKSIFFDNDSVSYKYKLIKSSPKLIFYDEKNIKIYDMIDSDYTNLEISLGESDDNIKIIQNFSNNLYIIITDKYLFIFDAITESIIHKIPKKLQFGFEKILLLNNNQFLLYSDSSAIIYNYDFNKKLEKPEISKELNLNNVKNIKKILQIQKGDLVIFYDCFNFAVFDLKYNYIKFKKLGKELNYVCHDIFPNEIKPNIIVYKTDLYNINFIDIIKGEVLGSFGIKNNNILSFKKIKKYYISSERDQTYNKMYYFILAGKDSYILNY